MSRKRKPCPKPPQEETEKGVKDREGRAVLVFNYLKLDLDC